MSNMHKWIKSKYVSVVIGIFIMIFLLLFTVCKGPTAEYNGGGRPGDIGIPGGEEQLEPEEPVIEEEDPEEEIPDEENSGEEPEKLSLAGSGTAEDPYQIASLAHLLILAEQVNEGNTDYYNKNYILVNNIDLSFYTSVYLASKGKGWIPIGTDSTKSFSGVFNGNNKKITGLYIDNKELEYAGLFGHIGGGSVHNLGVENAYVNGGKFAGAIAGYSKGTIQYVFSTGNIICNIVEKENPLSAAVAGGLVGYNASVVQYSYSSCSVTGYSYSNEKYTAAGGLAGWNSTDASIRNSYSTGDVTSGTSFAGGIVGRNDGIVENTYASGNVFGSVSIGGLAGGGITSVNLPVLKNSVALNLTMTSNINYAEKMGRVIGSKGSHDISNNYAYEEMNLRYNVLADGTGGKQKNIISDTSGTDGSSLRAAQIKEQSTWMELYFEFNDSVWKWTAGKMPHLFDHDVHDWP